MPMLQDNRKDFLRDLVYSIIPYTMESIEKIQKTIVESKYEYFFTGYYSYKDIKYPTPNGDTYVIRKIPINLDPYDDFTFDDIYDLGKAKRPILFFADGKFIPWHKIQIINSRHYIYIHFKDLKNIKEIKTFELNFNVQYTHGLTNEEGFSFDKDGNFTLNNLQDNINIEIDDNRITFHKSMITDGNYYPLVQNKEQQLLSDSLIFFNTDGTLTEDANGKYKIDTFNKLTVKDFNGFYIMMHNNTSYNKTILNLSNFFKDVDKWEKYVNQNQLTPILETNLDISDIDNTKPDYFEKVTERLLNLNFELFSDLFYKYYNWITPYNWKVSEINKDKRKILTMLNKNKEDFTSTILAHVNGRLITKNYGVNYDSYLNEIYLDLKPYKDNDDIMIDYYKRTDNRVFKILLTESEEYYIDPSFNMDNCKLYSTFIPNHEYNIFNNEKCQYEIEYTYKKIREGVYTITPVDNIYYNSEVSLVSNEQFRHYSIKADNHLVKVELPDEFKFCKDILQYQVYINGNKQSLYDVKFAIPMDTNPINTTMVYLSCPVAKGDVIDVVYTPVKFREVACIRNITSNIIEIDKNKLEYPLDSKLYKYYINGRLIRNEGIQYISNNKIVIDPKLFYGKFNLSIIQTVNEDHTFLKGLFASGDDIITNATRSMSPDNIYDITGIKPLGTNSEDSISKDNFSRKSLVFEVVRDFWAGNNGVYAGDPFIYDFDNIVLEGGNNPEDIYDIYLLDANKFDKIDCKNNK